MKTKTDRINDIFNYLVSRKDFVTSHSEVKVGDIYIGYYSNESKDYYQIKFDGIVLTVNSSSPYTLETSDRNLLEVIENFDFDNWISTMEKAIEKENKQIDIEVLSINGKKYRLIEE